MFGNNFGNNNNPNVFPPQPQMMPPQDNNNNNLNNFAMQQKMWRLQMEQQEMIQRQQAMLQQQNNNNPNNFQPQQPMMQNPMMQQQAMMLAMMQQQIMMQQQNVGNDQQNNSPQPQDDEGLSSSIATNIINVILGSSHTSCDGFQKALATKEITDRLNSDPSILTNYRNGLINVLQRILSNGATYKKMENGALRVFGGSDRVMDFMKDKIISYYAYGGGDEASSMRAFFEGKKYYKYNSQDIYFDLIKCEYDLNKKTYKIIITLQGTEKEVIFKGDSVSQITGVKSAPHGFYVVVNGNILVDMSNDVDKINQNFKDNNLKITADFIEPNKENTTHTNNDINDQGKFYDNFNYKKLILVVLVLTGVLIA